MRVQVAKLHEEARRRGKANVVTYSAAISACAKEKRWRDALALLAEMRRDVRLTKTVFSSIRQRIQFYQEIKVVCMLTPVLFIQLIHC